MMNIINSVSENVMYCTRNFRRSKILMNNVLRNHKVLRWTEPILYELGEVKVQMVASQQKLVLQLWLLTFNGRNKVGALNNDSQSNTRVRVQEASTNC